MANVVAILTEILVELDAIYAEASRLEKELEDKYYSVLPRDRAVQKDFIDAQYRAFTISKQIGRTIVLVYNVRQLDIPDAIDRRKDATIAWARRHRK